MHKTKALQWGSLTAIGGIMGVAGPLTGTPLLALIGHLRPRDWREGITFFLCAFLQAIALALALRHFRTLHQTEIATGQVG